MRNIKPTVEKLPTPSEINEDDSFSQKIQEAIHFKPLPKHETEVPSAADESILNVNLSIDSDNTSPLVNPTKMGVSLRDFETQRKLIEEQNRQKKDILCKAIEQQ